MTLKKPKLAFLLVYMFDGNHLLLLFLWLCLNHVLLIIVTFTAMAVPRSCFSGYLLSYGERGNNDHQTVYKTTRMHTLLSVTLD